jgi:hypothetical protein
MIKSFYKVRDNLYRGGAPSVADLISLVKKYGIEKVVSLDKEAGEKITPFCKKLGVEQVIIGIDPSNIKSLKNLLSHNINDLLSPDTLTFVHCRRGKDRAGLVIALSRCITDGWSSRKALKEAKSLGFGTGLDLPIEKFYTKLINKAGDEESTDSNDAYDIVSNTEDDYNNMYHDDQFDLSFAPFADGNTRKYPEAFVDVKPYDEQYPTRENYGLKGIDTEEESKNVEIPSVGVYDQNTQITNMVGPSIISGGFV